MMQKLFNTKAIFSIMLCVGVVFCIYTVIEHGYRGDLAERMPLSTLASHEEGNQYMPSAAEVIVVDNNGFVEKCNVRESTFVIGIVSTNPAHTLRGMIKGSVPVALSGIVPCKVTSENGMIKTGDLLVSATKPGYAMKAPSKLVAGTVLGKAMDQQEEEEDIITVLIMLR